VVIQLVLVGYVSARTDDRTGSDPSLPAHMAGVVQATERVRWVRREA
jgi:hypothetical protein